MNGPKKAKIELSKPLSPNNPLEKTSPVEVRNVICKIKLSDNSVIEIRDQRRIDNCKILQKMADMTDGTASEIALLQFEPKFVRFVLTNVIPFIGFTKNIDDFKKSAYFNDVLKEFKIEGILKLMEVANFLDCQPVIAGLGVIAASHLKRKPCKELLHLFGLQVNSNRAQITEVLDQTKWFMGR